MTDPKEAIKRMRELLAPWDNYDGALVSAVVRVDDLNFVLDVTERAVEWDDYLDTVERNMGHATGGSLDRLDAAANELRHAARGRP